MNKHRTNHEHVQAIREGKDYYSPRLAINETIDHLVNCALIVKNTDQPLTAETRALDAIGVQIERELKNRAEMINALTDRLTAIEGERDVLIENVRQLREELYNTQQGTRVLPTRPYEYRDGAVVHADPA